MRFIKNYLTTILLFITVITVILLVWNLVNSTPDIDNNDGNLESTTSQVNNITLINDKPNGIRIVIFRDKQLKYFYVSENKQTVEKQVTSLGLEAAINSGYFTGTYTKAQHAGLLYLNGEKVVNIALHDSQITHVVSYTKDKQLKFIANSDFKIDSSINFAFQAGPLVLNKGKVQEDYIGSSKNGNGHYKRTLLGQTSQGTQFFLVAIKPYSLGELADYITKHPENFGTDSSVINLDGGPSTTLYVKYDSLFNTGIEWFLPNLIGF